MGTVCRSSNAVPRRQVTCGGFLGPNHDVDPPECAPRESDTLELLRFRGHYSHHIHLFLFLCLVCFLCSFHPPFFPSPSSSVTNISLQLCLKITYSNFRPSLMSQLKETASALRGSGLLPSRWRSTNRCKHFISKVWVHPNRTHQTYLYYNVYFTTFSFHQIFVGKWNAQWFIPSVYYFLL